MYENKEIGIHNLSKLSYKFNINVFYSNFYINGLKYLSNIIKIIGEPYRISEPSIKIIIGFPRSCGHNANTDLKLKRAFRVRYSSFFVVMKVLLKNILTKILILYFLKRR